MRLLSASIIAAAAALAGAASAQDCKDTLTAYSEEATPLAIPANELARDAAKGAWERRCERLHGDIYCSWPEAQGRRLICGTRNNGLGFYNYTCKAEARPCSPY